VLLERIIHIFFNRLAVCKNIVVNLLLNEPSKEVELTDSGDKGCLTTCLKLNTFTAAKWVKKTLGIGIELTLVVEIYKKMAILLSERCIHLLSIVGHEIIN